MNNGGKRLVLPIKLSVPLLCRSIYDVRFTIPNTSLVKSTSVLAADYELTSLTIARQSTQMFLEASEKVFASVCPVLTCIDKSSPCINKRFSRTCLEIDTYFMSEISLRCLFMIAVLILSVQ